jgi:FkbM family methyltransferase
MKNNTYTKWRFLREHFKACVVGSMAAATKHPVKFWTVLWSRTHFFVTRGFRPCRTPEGFTIESKQELCSYWEIFIQHALHGRWLSEMAAEQNPVVLDIGANAGVFTRLIQAHNPTAILLAFEPQLRFKNKLERVLQSGQGRVFTVALSDKQGVVTFTTQEESGHVAKAGESGYEVPAERLDSLVNEEMKIFILKLDVDGHEIAVLHGAAQTLKRTRYVLSEAMSLDELEAITAELKGWKRGQLDSINWLFENPSQTNGATSQPNNHLTI